MKIHYVLNTMQGLVALGLVSLSTSYAGVDEQLADLQSHSWYNSLPSFSAVYRYSHQPSDTVLDSARVNVSAAGFRVDQLTKDSGNAVIANFESDQMWFLDSQRELVHEVPLLSIDASEKTDVEPLDELLPGFVQARPCQGMQAVFIEDTNFRGHALSRWRCLSVADEQLQEQLYSKSLGIVLWSQDTDGFVSEFVDVRMSTPNPGIFEPPSHYREVEISELINGSPSIDTYEEGNQDPEMKKLH